MRTPKLSINRLNRIDSVLIIAPAFIGRERVIDFEGIKYPQLVMAVADKLISEGREICTTSKEHILKAACDIERLNFDEILPPKRTRRSKEIEELTAPTDNHIRRVYSVLRNSTAESHLSRAKLLVSSPKGIVEVSEDAKEIASLIFSKGIDACTLRREDIYAYAEEFLSTKGISVSVGSSKPIRPREHEETPRSRFTAHSSESDEWPEENLESTPTPTLPQQAPLATAIQDETPPEEPQSKLQTRVARVEMALRLDGKLKKVLSRPTVPHFKNGAPIFYSKEACGLTDKLLSQNLDPLSMPIPEIVQKGFDFLGMNTVDEKKGEEIDIPFAMSIYTLLLSCMQLSTLDKAEGSDIRRKSIEDIANQYRKLF